MLKYTEICTEKKEVNWSLRRKQKHGEITISLRNQTALKAATMKYEVKFRNTQSFIPDFKRIIWHISSFS